MYLIVKPSDIYLDSDNNYIIKSDPQLIDRCSWVLLQSPTWNIIIKHITEVDIIILKQLAAAYESFNEEADKQDIDIHYSNDELDFLKNEHWNIIGFNAWWVDIAFMYNGRCWLNWTPLSLKKALSYANIRWWSIRDRIVLKQYIKDRYKKVIKL